MTPQDRLKTQVKICGTIIALLAACRNAHVSVLVEPSVAQTANDYLREIAVDDPLGHWSLDTGPNPVSRGAIPWSDGRALRCSGTCARQLTRADDISGYSLTVELWARHVRGTLLSYAADDGPAFALRYTSSLELVVGDRSVDTEVTLPEGGSFTQIAVTWEQASGRAAVDIDGRNLWQGELSTEVLPRNGIWILGQEQGCRGGASCRSMASTATSTR